MRQPLLGLAAVLLLLVPAAQAQTIRWEIPTEYPATAMPGEGLARFARALDAASTGRIAAAPSFDAALGLRSRDMIEAVRTGRVPAADAFAGALAETHPIFLVSSLPFLITSIDDAWRLHQAARPSYEAVLARHNQRLLFATPWPPSGIWALEPIIRPASLRGLRIRTYDATGTAVFKAAGASPTELSFADVMPKLQDGSVNAVLSSGDGGAGRRLWEFLPHFTEINYAMPVSLVTLNLDAWKALPPELQAAVETAAAETEAGQWQLIRTRLEANYATMRANGVTIATTVTRELRSGLSLAIDAPLARWREQAGDEGRAVIDRYRQR